MTEMAPCEGITPNPQSTQALAGDDDTHQVTNGAVTPSDDLDHIDVDERVIASKGIFQSSINLGESGTLSSPVGDAQETAIWPEKSAAITNFVEEKGAVGHNNIVRVFSGKGFNAGRLSSGDSVSLYPLTIKGRVILYTKLGCEDCMEARRFLRERRLTYTEINIDLYPGRENELRKLAQSSSVPKVFFNEVLLGGLNDLKRLNESTEIDEKIRYVAENAPSLEAPWPPLSGEDDESCSGPVDELSLITQKMKSSIAIKNRFRNMRRYSNCFLGNEAVDFLSEDQRLEREEAVIFARKLASKLFFSHVQGKNIFEDSVHLYRFLDDDPTVQSQCYNMPRGITETKPKPITEIARRLKILMTAILEAYASPDGKHVDYRSIHGSEEFARYLRIAEELQRVELTLTREQRLSFFINLYNMMSIHAILVMGYPDGPMQRRKLFGEFQYVISGCLFSLGSIHHGILRANEKDPSSFLRPFEAGDRRSDMTLAYVEPLVHFAVVHGARSGPALRCYSAGDIDEELREAARGFLRGGGISVDFDAKVAHVTKIVKWFWEDFGRNEVEAVKHASIFLDPSHSQPLFHLLDDSDFKLLYQPFNWDINV